ncbi:hypothetical protein T484DRAFT_3153467 [Baffinella frigidus]|nr:hypothetical protein T484DRAFT_3153467 [Cryptophyta sp. CCMP2293]
MHSAATLPMCGTSAASPPHPLADSAPHMSETSPPPTHPWLLAPGKAPLVVALLGALLGGLARAPAGLAVVQCRVPQLRRDVVPLRLSLGFRG